MRKWITAALVAGLLAGCGGDDVALRPASKARLDDSDRFEFAKPFKVASFTITVGSPRRLSADDENAHYYGASTWEADVHLENRSGDTQDVPAFDVVCSNTDKEGADWVSRTLTRKPLPPHTTADGTIIVSSPIDFGTGKPLECSSPHLQVSFYGQDASVAPLL